MGRRVRPTGPDALPIRPEVLAAVAPRALAYVGPLRDEAAKVLHAMQRGAFLLDDRGGGARMGVYLSEGPGKNTPVNALVFAALEVGEAISLVPASRNPPRWRASESGLEWLKSLDAAGP